MAVINGNYLYSSNPVKRRQTVTNLEGPSLEGAKFFPGGYRGSLSKPLVCYLPFCFIHSNSRYVILGVAAESFLGYLIELSKPEILNLEPPASIQHIHRVVTLRRRKSSSQPLVNHKTAQPP
jgi:hypothetical protein